LAIYQFSVFSFQQQFGPLLCLFFVLQQQAGRVLVVGCGASPVFSSLFSSLRHPTVSPPGCQLATSRQAWCVCTVPGPINALLESLERRGGASRLPQQEYVHILEVNEEWRRVQVSISNFRRQQHAASRQQVRTVLATLERRALKVEIADSGLRMGEVKGV